VDLYYHSIGRGGSLLLNLPPDRRGRIHETDAAALGGMRRILDATFGEDLASGALAGASGTRGGAAAFGPARVLDADRATYWSTDDAQTTPELVLGGAHPVTFNVVSLREALPLGQRVTAWALDAWQDGAWQEFASGQAIGARRLWRGGFVTTDRLRLRITDAPVCPAISEVGVFAEPARVEIDAPGSAFLGSTRVSLRSNRPGARVRYTLDGGAPDARSAVYESPIELAGSAVVRTAAEVDGVLSPFVESRAFTAYSSDSLRPAISLVRAPHQGLSYAYFEGGWQTLDQLAGREPVARGVAAGFELDMRRRDEHFAVVYLGYIHVKRDGLYGFSTSSDDGSRLWVQGELVVENDGLHGMVERSGVIGLKAGYHPFRVEYFNAAGQLGLEVRCRPPDIPMGAIPNEALFGDG